MYFVRSVLTPSGNLHPLSSSIIYHSTFPVTLLSAVMQFTLVPLDPIRISHITEFFQLCSTVFWDCLVLTSAACFPPLQFFAQGLTSVDCTFNLTVSQKIKINAWGYYPVGSPEHSNSVWNTVEGTL